jgi:peptidoglycan/xylan/chitin deacetylase (PgdA/CDA1 family)
MLENVVPPSGSSLALQRYTERVANSDVRVHHRFTLLSSGWAGVAWQLANAPSGGGSDGGAYDVPVSDHATRLDYARTRRGGGIGTGGRAVVMLRFDHWLVAFRDKVLPILRQHDLPATLNVNYDNLSNSQNGGGSITWAHVQDWNQYDAVEIANHGATHTDASTTETIYHEVVEGRRLLEAAMPRVAVETWQEHGSAYLIATDVPGDTGLNLGRTLSSFTESYAGKLVMAEHAVVEGKCGGFFVNLNGTPQVGQSHYSIDRSTDAEAIAQVSLAQDFERGITLYVHPGLLDTVLVNSNLWPATYNGDGSVDVTDPATSNVQHFATETEFRDWATAGGHIIYMRSAHLAALCAHLAAERAAGRVMVMTAAGGAFADKSHARRENLLVKPGFTTGFETWWSNRTGWTVTNPGPGVTLTSDGTAGPMSQGMLLHTRFGWAMGAAHELVVKAKAGAATTLTLSVEQSGNPTNWKTEKVHAIPGDNTAREYRLNLTLPRDTTITQMTVRIGGPNLTIEGPPLLAAI